MTDSKHTSFRLTRSESRTRHLRTGMKILGSVQLIMVVWAFIELARGTPDTYHNEHLRSVASGIGTLSNVAALLLITRKPEQRATTLLGCVLIFLSLVTLTWSWSLANGR